MPMSLLDLTNIKLNYGEAQKSVQIGTYNVHKEFRSGLNDPIQNKAHIKIIFRDLICALNCLHYRGYIYRDVKIENV